MWRCCIRRDPPWCVAGPTCASSSGKEQELHGGNPAGSAEQEEDGAHGGFLRQRQERAIAHRADLLCNPLEQLRLDLAGRLARARSGFRWSIAEAPRQVK